MGYLGNPKMVLMTQDSVPVANYEVAGNPTASINPVRVPVTWLNTLTGCRFLCTDNTPGANVWKLMSGFRGALVYLNPSSSDQVISHNTWTAVGFDTEAYDTDAFHDSSTNNSRLTIPTGVTRVRLSAGIEWVAAATGVRGFGMRKSNSSAYPGFFQEIIGPDASLNTTEHTLVSPPLVVSAGDYFEIVVYHNAGVGATRSINASNSTWFAVEVIE